MSTVAEVDVEQVIHTEDWAVQVTIGAATVTLDPTDAESLAEQLSEAAREPERCAYQVFPQTRVDPAEYCMNYAVDDGLCAGHAGAGEL